MINQLYDIEKLEGNQSENQIDQKTKNLYIKARAYLLNFKAKHLKLIEETIQKYQNNQYYQKLVIAINYVLAPITSYQAPNLRGKAMFLMKTLFKLTIQQELTKMPQNERIRYQRIQQQTISLQAQASKDIQGILVSCEIKSLLYQDVLSLLLLQSQLFQKACNSLCPLFYTNDLVNLLDFFKKEEVKRLTRQFSKSLNLLIFEGINGKIVRLIKIYTIIVLRFRVYSIVTKVPNYKMLHPLSNLLADRIEDQQIQKKQQHNPYQYYLSEISIFIHFKELTSIPSSWINPLVYELKENVKYKGIQQKKWLLLRTKIKYNISFHNLCIFLNFIERDEEEKIQNMLRCEQYNAKDYYKFFQAQPYIFLKNESYAQAFQKRGFNKEFDITHRTEGTVKCEPFLYSLMLLSSILRCAKYRIFVKEQIQSERLFAKILVIMKYEFTYNEMRSYFTTPFCQDISITLILGTIDKNFVFCEVTFTNLSETQYVNSIKKLVLQSKIATPFHILIRAYNDFVPFSRKALISLYQFGRKMGIRVYISTFDEQGQFNTLLFCFIYSKMIKKSAFPPQGFEDFFRKELQREIAKIQNIKR